MAGNNPVMYGYVKDVNREVDFYGLKCKKIVEVDTVDDLIRKLDKSNPIVVIGERMKRVELVANQLRAAGFDVRTYNPRNFRSMPGSLSKKDLDANRSWISYWANNRNANVVDIGIDPTPGIPRSPFYGIQHRSVYNNWSLDEIFKLNNIPAIP